MRLYTDEQVKVLEIALRAILITADDLEMHSTKRRTEAALATLRSGQDVTGEAFAYCNQADIDKLKADKWACVEVSAYKVDGSENIPLHLAAPTQSAQPAHIRSIKIPTDTMEQEFQTHYRRGYEAGKLTQSAQIPAGWKLVPATPTPEMVAICQSIFGAFVEDTPADYKRIYAAMLSASPQSAQQIPADVAKDALDAKRYRWLRQRDHGKKIGVEIRIGGYMGMYWLGANGVKYETALDAAIDAAIAAQGEQQ
jgi:hypothetical protein